MNVELFSSIKAEYGRFYRSLLKNCELPLRSTEKGFWNGSISDEIYEIFTTIALGKFNNFLDIGSGDGKVALIASLFCKKAEGVEVDSMLHNKAIEIRDKLKINNAIFHNKDFFKHDFSKYDVLFVAPDAPMERGLESKLLKEMKGKLIHLGHHFHPRFLKKEESFVVKESLVTVYSN